MSDPTEYLRFEDRQAIGEWLDRIGERDPEIRGELLRRADAEPRARAYLLAQAAQLKDLGR